MSLNILGIIAEYNPFHNGHKHHLEESMKLTNSTHSVAVMSGHFLQRGEPALIDKWTRASMAVSSGVDLVLELPHMYSSQSAEIFSLGGILTLEACGVINSICFGSESSNLEKLSKIADVLALEPPEFKELLQKKLKSGISFPKAREEALKEMFNEDSFSFPSNDILGIEYLKALFKLKSSIKPFCIARREAGYHSTDMIGSICSATAIRNYLKENKSLNQLKDFVPNETFKILSSKNLDDFMFLDKTFQILKYAALTNDISSIFDVSEGLENSILRELKNSPSLEDALNNIKSKRYSMTRIKRCLINLLTGISKDMMKRVLSDDLNLPYLRVLAFNSKGREILKEMKSKSKTPIIIKPSDFKASSKYEELLFNQDLKATDIYNLILEKPNWANLDLITSPIYKKKDES